jgi:hypothetical protein
MMYYLRIRLALVLACMTIIVEYISETPEDV